MNEQLIDVNLIRDNLTLAAISTELTALGEIMVCHNCGDLEALIEGLLVIERNQEAWPLCGECLRWLPLAGSIV